jgi:transcription initiation factor TFIID subunit 15
MHRRKCSSDRKFKNGPGTRNRWYQARSISFSNVRKLLHISATRNTDLSSSDDANFVNFCSGQTITNGKQITTGSCNGIPMGKLPATTNMISAMITNPNPGDKIPADTTFNISVQTAHLNAGFFVNPTTNYYTAPQDLDENGDIIGHCHVTVQNIGSSLKSITPPDPTTFAFFKGIDDNGNGKGLLQAVVTGGLPAGFYRVCTMIAARNHQPVNMPVAQRGAQDDCTKFEVVGQSGNANSGQTNAGKTAKGDPNMGSVTTAAPIAKGTQKSGSGNKGNKANTKAISTSAISSAKSPAKSATRKAKGVAGAKDKSSTVASAITRATAAASPTTKASNSKYNGQSNSKLLSVTSSPAPVASK